jgi:hypothetical protein
MCEYSLEFMASRPAKVGEQLVITKFPHSITRGFCSIAEPNIAVCLRPGTEIAFEDDVQYNRAFSIFPKKKKLKLNERTALFRQINLDYPPLHHDAVEFPSGQLILLTRLCEGQRATVLQLPVDASVVAKESDLTLSPLTSSGWYR